MKKHKKKVNHVNKIKKYFLNKVSEQMNDKFNVVEVVVIIFVSILFGAVVGFVLSSSRTFGTEVSSDVVEIINTYETIVDNYYGEIDKEELLNAAVSGMVSTLDDPYSVFMNSSDTKEFNETVDGSFVGIGITLEWNDGGFKIVEVLKDSPAEKAGLKSGDYLIKIDDKDTSDIEINDVSDLIKKKDKVSLTILRNDSKKVIEVEKAVIEIPSVFSEKLEDNIGYILIDNFTANTAIQFEHVLKKLEKQKIDSLIIDVRGNPGGRVNQVNDILELFFDKKTVLYQIGDDKDVKKIYSSKADKRKYPVVLLVDGASASASEILIACFRDNYKNATIVGGKTYGKGTIQKSLSLSSGASIKYTTQKWLTPKGEWINEIGIIPDVVVDYSMDVNQDIQLDKALEILKNK